MDYNTLLKNHRDYFATGETKDIRLRKRQLLRLKQAILANEAAINAALKEDLNKSSFEAYETEVGIVLDELAYMLRHMEGWARAKAASTPLAHFPSTSRVHRQPYGVVLIMSPWNYPFQLTMVPLIGAIAAGNCAVVKPSAYSPATSAVVRDILAAVFPTRYVSVLQGGREVNKALLDQRFDYIFFTGSVAVGKTVMRAAAEHLTPVTLELGGKSPCIVTDTANVCLAAKRIAWGKFLNAGQTCVAPDYVLVHESVKDQLVQQLWRYVQAFYGPTPHENADYPKIITQKHYARLRGLLAGESAVLGGRGNGATRQLEPTLLPEATWQSPAMAGEIFGPVLPILTYTSLPGAIEQINARPKPLALYLFTSSASEQRRVLRDTSSGGACVNDVVVHMASSHMPFGGVGESGMGACHGRASFDTFTHHRSVLNKSNLVDLPVRYPPHTPWKEKLLKLVLG